MTKFLLSFTVQQPGVGSVRITGICNGPQCSTCLTLSNGDRICVEHYDLDRDMLPVLSNGHDYIVFINKEAVA